VEKYIYDPTNGWCYEFVGDYYLPYVHSEDPTTKPDCHTPEIPTKEQPAGSCDNLQRIKLCKNSITPEAISEEPPIRNWSNRHLTYLRKHSPTVYREFLRSGTLHSYLAEIDRTAQAMYDRLIKQLANTYGITEELKAKDQMEWVRTMNSIRNTAEEIVLSEVIYQ